MVIAIIAVTIVFLVFTAYLGYTSSMHKSIKMLSLPLFLLLASMVGWTYYDNLGAPIQREVPEKFEYVAHKVTGTEFIHVYLYTKERGDRLYVIPYTRDAAKELAKAKKMVDGGAEVIGEKDAKESKGNNKSFKVRVKNPREMIQETKG